MKDSFRQRCSVTDSLICTKGADAPPRDLTTTPWTRTGTFPASAAIGWPRIRRRGRAARTNQPVREEDRQLTDWSQLSEEWGQFASHQSFTYPVRLQSINRFGILLSFWFQTLLMFHCLWVDLCSSSQLWHRCMVATPCLKCTYLTTFGSCLTQCFNWFHRLYLIYKRNLLDFTNTVTNLDHFLVTRRENPQISPENLVILLS